MNKWWKRLAWVTIAVLFAPVGLFVCVVGGHMLRFVGVLQSWDFPNHCSTKKSVKAENVGGFDFEFEVVDCLMDDDTVRMIFVSHHGQHQRHRLTVYGDMEQTPVAKSVAPQTVRLSLGNVASFSLREDHWRDLKVIYDYHPPMRREPDRP